MIDIKDDGTDLNDDLAYFKAYYKKTEFGGIMFKQFKQMKHRDKRILALLANLGKRKHLRRYINNKIAWEKKAKND